MADKYPKPYVPTFKLTPEYDSYSYATVFGYCVARLRIDHTWRVLDREGNRVGRSSDWYRAMLYALTLRPPPAGSTG